MKKLLCVVALMVAGCATQGPRHDYRQVVEEVLEKGLAGDLEVVRKYVPENYIQHNPMAKDGRAGLIAFIEYLQSQPAEARPKLKVVRFLQDGEFVFAHSELTAAGDKVAVMDVWRVGDGMLLEHWDCIEAQPERTASGRGMVDGTIELADRDKTEANKRLIKTFADEVLARRDLKRFDDFVAESVIQHDPHLEDGRAAWRSHLSELYDIEFKYTPVRVIGEGNFVIVQSKLTLGDEFVTYQLFRIENGKIAEHWSTKQAVPANPANDNGMLP